MGAREEPRRLATTAALFDSSKRARFTVDRRIGPLVIGPDLRSGERDKQTEDNAQWWQHAGRDCLERARSPFARAVTRPWIPAVSKYVKPKTTNVIKKIGLCSQSLVFGELR
jgi:hypothetical protein